MNSDILIYLDGGLGNRLSALYSTYCIYLNHNLKMEYFWASDEFCNCDFYDLFSKSNKLNFIKKDNFLDILDKLNKKDPSKSWRKTDRILKINEIGKIKIWHNPLNASLENYPIDFIKSFNKIKISPEVENRADSVCDLSAFLGVHVRGGDIKLGKQHREDKRKYVPPEVFFLYLNKSLKQNQKFFLSCEDKEDEEKFDKKYYNLIKLKKCTHNRNTKEGMIDGFVNMILLSRCKKIIGSVSSFSALASYVSGKHKVNVGENFIKKIKIY